jgi:hypothetical protein
LWVWFFVSFFLLLRREDAFWTSTKGGNLQKENNLIAAVELLVRETGALYGE